MKCGWQGKSKYSEKTCPDATLSTTNPTCQTRARTRAAAVGSQRLTASAMARPTNCLDSNLKTSESTALITRLMNAVEKGEEFFLLSVTDMRCTRPADYTKNHENVRFRKLEEPYVYCPVYVLAFNNFLSSA
jgi:hypothetical protein